MIFSYNWLQSFFQRKPRSRINSLQGRLPKPEKLAELLTMHSFEVEELKKVKSDWVLDIDILPNRGPDCFSHIGMAREIAAITDLRFKIQDLRLKEDKKLKAKDFIRVKVENKNDCYRYTARVVVGVKVGPSPKWLQERLEVCGLRPINSIVDVANYVMLESGQPLHAFDFDKIKSDTNIRMHTNDTNKKVIIVRRAKKREKIITLDGEKYDLGKDILVIADIEGPLAIAGIKGGKKAEIDKKTKTVVLESANFNPKVVRKGSQRLGLKTDASLRFEHGIDPNLTEKAINRAAGLIQEVAKGKVVSGIVDFYPKKALSKKIKLDFDYVEKLLGVKISEKEIRNILKRLEFKLSEVGPRAILVEVPTFRLDISLPEDLIEEIGRIYGYQRIPDNFPVVSLIPPKKNLDIFWEDFAKNILKEARFSEVYNYSFVGEEIKNFGYKKEDVIEIENPVSVEQKYLRPSLIPNLLKNVKENFNHFNEIKIFELGKIFFNEQRTKNREQSEKKMLAGVIAQKQEDNNGFYYLKGVIDSLLNKLGISNVWYDEYQPTPEESKISIWQPKKCAEVKIDGQEIGFLGEISQRLLETLKIKGKIFLFDIDFEKLTKLCSEEHEYQPISQYPAAVRDLALLVPQGVKVEEVLNKIEISGGLLIRDVDLFDIYEGDEIPAGKKNLAFHIVYQAEDRTLKSEEIDKIQEKIIKNLEENPEWEVRK